MIPRETGDPGRAQAAVAEAPGEGSGTRRHWWAAWAMAGGTTVLATMLMARSPDPVIDVLEATMTARDVAGRLAASRPDGFVGLGSADVAGSAAMPDRWRATDRRGLRTRPGMLEVTPGEGGTGVRITVHGIRAHLCRALAS